MDTKTFLLEREALQYRLQALRVSALSAENASEPWWAHLPLWPLVGWFAARFAGASKEKSNGTPKLLSMFLLSALPKLAASFFGNWKRSPLPSFVRRFFA